MSALTAPQPPRPARIDIITSESGSVSPRAPTQLHLDISHAQVKFELDNGDSDELDDDNDDAATLRAPLDGSSDDDSIDHDDGDDHDAETSSVHNAIGVSIGLAQTRLTSPKTPAAEKQAAIDRAGGFFSDLDLGEKPPDEDDLLELDQHKPVTRPVPKHEPVPEHEPQSAREPMRLHSPWAPTCSRPQQTQLPAQQQQQQQQQQDLKTKHGLLSSLPFTRKRAHTHGDSVLDGWHRALLATLPSLHRKLSSSSTASSTGGQARGESLNNSSLSQSEDRKPTPGQVDDAISPFTTHVPTTDDLEAAEARIGDLHGIPNLNVDRSRPQILRRTTSEGSLTMTRTLSHVPSLGDDGRWEDVSAQVNSRFKAIKDTWQDSSMRLSNIPRNLSVASFTPDFLRERSSSLSVRKQDSRDSDIQSISAGYCGLKPRKPEDPITRQPYTSLKAAAADAGATMGKHASHPNLTRALDNLKGDIVVLGGYRGSILRSAQAPHRQLWVPVKVGLNLRKVNLEVGFEEGDDERSTETVIPGGMLTHIGPVDISRRLLKRLRTCANARDGKLRVHEYGYDWRLHPAYLSGKLLKFLRTLPCNQPGVPKEQRGATVIAHSLGGLITRHAVNQEPALFRGVVYAGVPGTCVNILGPLRNGDEVLLSSRVLTAQVNFSIRTSFALLPLDGRCFIDKHTKEEYHVDFFDPQTWVDYRLSPCVARPLPAVNPPEKATTIASYVSSVTSALPSIPFYGRKTNIKVPKGLFDPVKAATAASVTEPSTLRPTEISSDSVTESSTATDADTGNSSSDEKSHDEKPSTLEKQHISPRIAVTIPHEKALAYLTRTLATVKKFKQELAFVQSHSTSNSYPPISVIYGKSVPTVYGARVAGREAIKHSDAYDDLAFASGDGVVLARAAMVPPGYRTARGGIVSSERGHVTLLGDLEAVGKCLLAVTAARESGVGLGME